MFSPRASARRLRVLVLAAGLLGGWGQGAWAEGVDWTLIGSAAGQASVKSLGVVAGWNRLAPLWQGDTWRLDLRHEAVLAAWHAPRARDLVEVGYTPVLRLQRPVADGQRVFFVEGGIGVRLLTHTRVSAEHRLSTAFQFADMLGVGMQFGPQARSTLGLRLQHLSNLGIKRPNPGIDFVQVYYTHRF